MDISLNFDSTFHTQFGAESYSVLVRVVNLAQPMFYWGSLSTTIKLRVVEIKGHLGQAWIATAESMYTFILEYFA